MDGTDYFYTFILPKGRVEDFSYFLLDLTVNASEIKKRLYIWKTFPNSLTLDLRCSFDFIGGFPDSRLFNSYDVGC